MVGKLPRQDSNLRPVDKKAELTAAHPKQRRHLSSPRSARKHRNGPESDLLDRPQTVPKKGSAIREVDATGPVHAMGRRCFPKGAVLGAWRRHLMNAGVLT